MSAHTCFVGVKPATGIVNTIGGLDTENVMEALRAGETVIPCTTEQARALWGKQVFQPLNLCLSVAAARATSQPEGGA